MGKRPTYPDHLENLIKLDVGKFKIKPNLSNQGSASYRGNNFNYLWMTEETKGLMNFTTETKQLALINLDGFYSNLGGVIWFWKCPVTEKRCRKLYFYNGQFVHPSVIPLNYENQNYSKNMRLLDRMFRLEYSDVDEEIFKPYFKILYRGVPTRRFTRIMKKIEKNRAESESRYLEFVKILTKTNNKLK